MFSKNLATDFNGFILFDPSRLKSTMEEASKKGRICGLDSSAPMMAGKS